MKSQSISLADEIGEIEMMQAARKADVDAAVNEAFALQPRAEPGLDQKVGDPLLDHAGANPALDIVAAAPLQHHRVDAFPAQQMREHQPRRPRAYDPHLRAHLEPGFPCNYARFLIPKTSAERRDDVGKALNFSHESVRGLAAPSGADVFA